MEDELDDGFFMPKTEGARHLELSFHEKNGTDMTALLIGIKSPSNSVWKNSRYCLAYR